ncbi:MAG: 50S ribosomal protein L1 [Deltaproteobacteria bacterium CG_4_10_14_3_um_filter_60_8]|nr:MAG: 50S ribosomal protein L1 [Desulfobacterales bacterium CG2_30_60_27]PIP43924.1 MAG: 50S ribosomal protein L1 [Deltaproteobacteria bacterium CG23_combo_of_CG06-09_8_20_14_all_60_8]PIY21867.1 MAG: 50S ribosomal protein L1 [Deltaproteobacteria bacterium CG_4_10_14_3_um_filter_60_8]
MGKRGKKYSAGSAGIDPTTLFKLEEALEKALQAKYAKFDETLDVAIRLGVDPRHADQMLRSSVVLPNGTGKVVRVLVFAKGEKEKEALDAGADYAGSDEYVAKIQAGWLEFERTVATPDMMGTVGKIGRILGPRNLMPNAKVGTVTFDVGRVVQEIKSGKLDFKVDKTGIVHVGVGKTSFGVAKLKENILAFMDRIVQLKPASAKGIYMRSISLSTTMGPGFKLDPMEIRTLIKAAG